MKIVVSHFGRQHCPELLRAIHQKGWLSAFLTSLDTQKWLGLRWPASVRNALRKRAFTTVPPERVVHFPGLFALERALRPLLPVVSRLIADWFDRRVARRLHRLPCDLVITYENANRHTLKKARELGKITVLDLAQIHQDDIAHWGRWFMTSRQLETEQHTVNPRKAEALRYTDYVLALSDFAAQSMLRHGWPAERLFTVRLGIDPERFPAKQHYASSGPLRLLFVGTMTLRKGLAELLDAVRGLADIPLRLTLIGPMDDAEAVLASHAEIFDYLPFTHHEELVFHYQAADVFVFPSLLDSWAQTVLEAMACGTPAIVTGNTGASEVVRQGGGWVIPPHDVPALQEAIRCCARQREEIKHRGQKAGQLARAYTWARYHQALADTLENIARLEHLMPEPG